jgi:hypothetical protein
MRGSGSKRNKYFEVKKTLCAGFSKPQEKKNLKVLSPDFLFH